MTTGRSSGSTVESLMTKDPVVVTEDEPVAAVAELLAGFEISGLPVVDSEDYLVGVISETDLVRLRGSTLPWTGWHGLLVRDVMSRPARTIAAASALDAAARKMTAQHVHRLVVVDGKHVPIGVISESDLVREIADACDDDT
jgi:CBS domain-containing protein